MEVDGLQRKMGKRDLSSKDIVYNWREQICFQSFSLICLPSKGLSFL